MENIKKVKETVEGKTWEDALDKAFKEQRKEAKVDGFRKGTVPKDVFIKKYGIEVLYNDAIDTVISDALKSAIDRDKLKPVCEPKADVIDLSEKKVEFEFTIIEKPKVKLGDYKKVKVEKEKVSVSKEEIENEIKNLRDKHADIIEKTEGKVEKGNTATINFKGVVDGKELEGGSGENYPLEIGSNTFIPGFEEQLIGMEINEEKVIKLKFPEDYTEELKNKDVEFTVKVIGIKERIIPELNEEFYKDLGYEDIKTQNELESEISKHLLEHKEADAENVYLDKVLREAGEYVEVEINEEIIDEELNRIINQYGQQLQMQGINLEQYLEMTKTDINSLKEQMKPEAISRIKSRYLLEEIAENEKITISKEEVTEEIEKIAEIYGTTVDEIKQMIGDEEVINYDLKMRKAVEVLKSQIS